MIMRNQKGQLLLPMLCLIILFTIFFGLYLRWCRGLYWQMRMDITAEAVALSAARAQAQMLNNLATLQTAGNIFVPKVSLLDNDVAPMQLSERSAFLLYLQTVKLFLKGYPGYVGSVATTVAKANRADSITLPWPKPQHRLIPRKVTFWYWYGPYPLPECETFENVYYVRSWRTDLHNPQPMFHENAWAVTHKGTIGIASARLWLDVDPGDSMANGGFPSPNASWWEKVGIQCFYAHFNARLVPTSIFTKTSLTLIAQKLSPS